MSFNPRPTEDGQPYLRETEYSVPSTEYCIECCIERT